MLLPSGAQMHAAREPKGCTGGRLRCTRSRSRDLSALSRAPGAQAQRWAARALRAMHLRVATPPPATPPGALEPAPGTARSPYYFSPCSFRAVSPSQVLPLSWPLGSGLTSRVPLGLVLPLEVHVLPPPPPPEQRVLSANIG